MCPMNRIGTVDLFIVSHHAQPVSNSPQLVHALEARAVIINNGTSNSSITIQTKGGLIKSWQPYITGSNEDEDLKPLSKVGGEGVVEIPKKSIITLVGELQ